MSHIEIKNPKTHVVIVLDKSGSMHSAKEETIVGLNEHIDVLKKKATEENHDIIFSFVTFNEDVTEHFWGENVESLRHLSHEEYQPGGATAMRDAVGYTLKKLKDNDSDDMAYLVLVFSDGVTNSDKAFTVPALKEIIEGCQKTNRWTISYIGCSESYLEEIARQTGINKSNMASWDNSSGFRAAIGMNRSALRAENYFNSRVLGQMSVASCYASDDSEKVADFTKPEDNNTDQKASTENADKV